MLYGVCHLCRTQRIDRIIPLDDFDLEKASFLREHLRLPGLGETATRYFRDKLAMRTRAAEHDIAVPDHTHCQLRGYYAVSGECPAAMGPKTPFAGRRDGHKKVPQPR